MNSIWIAASVVQTRTNFIHTFEDDMKLQRFFSGTLCEYHMAKICDRIRTVCAFNYRTSFVFHCSHCFDMHVNFIIRERKYKFSIYRWFGGKYTKRTNINAHFCNAYAIIVSISMPIMPLLTSTVATNQIISMHKKPKKIMDPEKLN